MDKIYCTDPPQLFSQPIDIDIQCIFVNKTAIVPQIFNKFFPKRMVLLFVSGCGNSLMYL